MQMQKLRQGFVSLPEVIWIVKVEAGIPPSLATVPLKG